MLKITLTIHPDDLDDLRGVLEEAAEEGTLQHAFDMVVEEQARTVPEEDTFGM